MDTNENKQQVTSLSTTTTSGGTAANCVWKRPSTNRSMFERALCRFIWIWRQIKQVEKALSSLDMDVPALEATRKMLEQQLTELRSQQRAQQPLSKRLESARRAPQRAQQRAEEAKVVFTLAQSVKEQADQEAAKIQFELYILEKEVHKSSYGSHRRTPSCTTQSWSACRTLGAGSTSGLHTHQRIARTVHSCWSGDGCGRTRRPNDAQTRSSDRCYRKRRGTKKLPDR